VLGHRPWGDGRIGWYERTRSASCHPASILSVDVLGPPAAEASQLDGTQPPHADVLGPAQASPHLPDLHARGDGRPRPIGGQHRGREPPRESEAAPVAQAQDLARVEAAEMGDLHGVLLDHRLDLHAGGSQVVDQAGGRRRGPPAC
jgi:hypothetical protein